MTIGTIRRGAGAQVDGSPVLRRWLPAETRPRHGNFDITRGVRIPQGGCSLDNAIVTFTAGQQHRVTGVLGFEIGSFYDGTKRTATYKGRVELSPRFGLEPNISLNWIDLPQGRFTESVLGGRGTFTVTPRMFVAAGAHSP